MREIILMKKMPIIIRIKHKLILCMAIVCHISLVAIFAQDLDRQLTLVRPYDPSVMEAQKITTLPNLRDSFEIKPSFVYSIQSKRIETRFDVTPIKPATLQPIPQTKLYNGYIKVGVGTLPNLLTEVAINTLRNKDYAAGALLKFDGARGNVKLENNEKTFAGYNEISAKVFGQKFFRNNSILYGEVGASGQTAYNYGYDTDAIDVIGNPIVPNFENDDICKRYGFADANVGIRSSHFRTNQLNYDVALGYKFAGNNLDEFRVPVDTQIDDDGYARYRENAINFKAQLDNNMFGGNVNFDVFNRSSAFNSLRNNFALDINPWFMLDNDSIRMKIGMRIAAYREGDNVLQYGIYPKIEFQFTLLKDIFIPFIGIDGYMRPNTYRDIIEENPFITPGLAVPMTNTKWQIYAGLKGNLASVVSYYLRADFLTTEHEHFFVNDTAFSRVQNYFTVVTEENVNTLNLKGELYFNPTESIDFGVKANYYSYQMKYEKHAWHRPEFTLELLAKYNLRNKIIVNFDMMCIGKRYAKKFFDPENDSYELNRAIAFNIGAEYRYTKSFSIFVKLNNLSGAKYERWNFYPSHRFNAMLGFTYSL